MKKKHTQNEHKLKIKETTHAIYASAANKKPILSQMQLKTLATPRSFSPTSHFFRAQNDVDGTSIISRADAGSQENRRCGTMSGEDDKRDESVMTSRMIMNSTTHLSCVVGR
jgi:hypothetical protein